jgi:uncharacterized membrane protein YkvA (DUF1232 family)
MSIDGVDDYPQELAIDDSSPVARRTWHEVSLEAALLLPNLVKLLVRLLADPRVPLRRKVFVGAVIAYVVSPVDLIPDFVIGLGHLDDIVLVSLAVDHLMTGTDEAVVLEHWDGSIDGLDLVRSVFAWGAEIVPSLFSRVLPR